MSAILYTGDNVQVMRERIADSSIQLTVTSPPYDNLRKYNGYAWDFEALARELYRVTKPGGVVVWVVADATINGSETCTSFKQALFFKECGFNLHDTMIWYKPNPNPRQCGPRYKHAHEYMFVLSKGAVNVFNPLTSPCKLAGKLHKRVQRENHIEGVLSVSENVIGATKVRGNVWDIAPRGLSFHVACFPESLAQDHVLSWSNPGDLVLDPFSGSGTTGKMAVINNRNFIGIEISPEYVQLQLARIPGAVLSPSGEIKENR
jgi:DNA modification methylase